MIRMYRGAAKVSHKENATRDRQRAFARVVVTGTGFSADEREVLKEWVLKLGLQYSGDLVCRCSTHLVCKDLFRALYGPKYVRALQWGVHIVSFRWIYDSLQAGHLLPTAGYKADEPGPAHVALQQAVSLRVRIAALQDTSRIPLGELCTNSQEKALHDGNAVVLIEHANNPKKRPAGCGQEADFTFDLTSRSSGQDCSPRLCHAVSTVQPTPIAVEDSSGCQPFAAVGKELKAAAEGRPQQTDANAGQREADHTGHLNLSSPSCKPLELPIILPTPSTFEVSFSELNAEVTISVPDDDASTQREGLDITPISKEICNGANVTSYSAGRLATPTDFTAPCSVDPDNDFGSTAVTDNMCPQEAVAGSRGLHIQAPAHTPKAEAAAAHGSVKLPGAPPQLDAVQPPPQASVLYSGFDVPLAAIATVTKGRRLVRTDRWSVGMNGNTAGNDAKAELPSCAHLEDDLEDDLEDSPYHATAEPALAHAFVRAADCKPAAQSCLPAAHQRPPLTISTPHDKNPSSAIESKGSGSTRFLHKPVPASAPNPKAFGDCGSRAQPRNRSENQQKQPAPSLQHDGQLGPRLNQRGSGSGSSVPIKAEPGCGDGETGPLGPAITQGPGTADGVNAGGRGVAVTHPSARRRAAVLGTSSLLSEPEEIAPWPLGRKGTEVPAVAPRRTCSDLNTLSDGYDSASSSRGTSSGLEDLNVGPSPSPDTSARPGSRAGPHQHQLAWEDSTQADEDQTGSISRKTVIGKTAIVNPCQDSIKTRVVSSYVKGFRHESTSEGEESPIDATGSALGPRRFGLGQVRNAAAIKPLPRAIGAKGDPQCRSGNAETAATIDAYVSEDQKCDGDIVSQAEAGSQLTVSVSQSLSLQLEDGSDVNKWPGEPLLDTKGIAEYLRMNALMAEEYLEKECPSAAGGLLSDSHIRVVKPMRRPRASTLALRHPCVSLKTVQFAEQILVEPLSLLLNCRDKSKRARCPLIALTNDDGAPEASMRREFFLGEPCNIYRLPSGDWWLEYYRYFTFDDVTVLAAAAGRPAKLPIDYDNRRELMRDTEPSHCRVSQVRGNMTIVRTKKVPPCERGKPAGSERPAFCRFFYDKGTGTLVTVPQAADLIFD
ncbi:hypothetical protein VaNZ11_005269 [Volvox africanus]|uniref:BRCT domain-containing protein n=1 Tax=Volvox africanus TaxID=51714 RepID=A0ABQ5RZF4_9CHLO|nr:hypothetical protein VaNZ11_005269 [Volvox africanus]